MPDVCPKCGHRRSPHEIVPDWQCPACGIVYAKFRPGGGATKPAPVAAPASASEEARPGVLGWIDRALNDGATAAFAPVLVLLHFWFATIVWNTTLNPAYRSLLDTALMPIHEGGHALFSFMGTFMAVLGGSLLQWLVPLSLIVGFIRQRDVYAVCAGVIVGGVSLNSTYVYMDSAFHMEKYPDLTFVSLGDASQEATHDWQYLFGAFRLYHESEAISAVTHALSLGLLWLGWLAGAWVLAQLISRRYLKGKA